MIHTAIAVNNKVHIIKRVVNANSQTMPANVSCHFGFLFTGKIRISFVFFFNGETYGANFDIGLNSVTTDLMILNVDRGRTDGQSICAIENIEKVRLQTIGGQHFI